MKFDGATVRARREQMAMRPEQLAAGIDRCVTSVLQYERGAIDPPASIVARLAEVLHVDPGELFTDAPALGSAA